MSESFKKNPKVLNVPVADPNVLFHEGTYYLYGTDEKRKGQMGNCVYTSKDLVNWTEQEPAFRKTDQTSSQGYFWGAEVIKKNDKFIMYYSTTTGKSSGPAKNMHIAAAISYSPLGPFSEVKTPLYAGVSGKTEVIDQNMFIDNDGQGYLYFVLVVLGSHNEIRVVRMEDDYLESFGESIICIRPELGWETHSWQGHRVAEGPFVFYRKGYYYLLYTCNHFLDDKYAVGYATSKSPLGPWQKFSKNPILEKNEIIRGPGNASLINTGQGMNFIAYHVHNSQTSVYPRQLCIDRLYFEPCPSEGPDIISIGEPVLRPQETKSES
jgi:beta-xylosidase